jgi:hypothetical protein
MAKNFDLEVKSAFMLDGKMRVPGKTVEGVSERMARDLLRRGKAVLLEGELPADESGPVSTTGKGGKKGSGNRSKGADAGGADGEGADDS